MKRNLLTVLVLASLLATGCSVTTEECLVTGKPEYKKLETSCGERQVTGKLWRRTEVGDTRTFVMIGDDAESAQSE